MSLPTKQMGIKRHEISNNLVHVLAVKEAVKCIHVITLEKCGKFFTTPCMCKKCVRLTWLFSRYWKKGKGQKYTHLLQQILIFSKC